MNDMSQELLCCYTNRERNNMPLPNPVYNYIVPIKRCIYQDSLPIHLHVIIPATTPQRAMGLAKIEFECDDWIINEDYENYKTI